MMDIEAMNEAIGADLPKIAVEVLRKRVRGIVLASLLLSIAGVTAATFLPDSYKATTTILVDPQKIPERYVSSTVTSDPNAHLNTLTQQVLSPSRIQDVVDRLQLYPDLRKRKSREEIVDYVKSKITIELKPGAEQGLSSFNISFTDKNRLLVAPVANMLAENFIQDNLKARQQQALMTTQFLTTELEKAQKSLEEQEGALEEFRMRHVGATPDQLDGNLQALSRLQAETQSHHDAIERLDEERLLLLQQRPSELVDTPNLSERARLTSERNHIEADIQNLRRQYKETYPDVVSAKAQLEAVQARIAALPAPSGGATEVADPAVQSRLNLIDKDAARHKGQLEHLQQEIGSYQNKVQSVPVLETQLTELTRNYETSRQNYQQLLDKKMSAGLSEDLERKQQAERFTVLDPAITPEKPFKPMRIPIYAGIIMASILMSSLCAVGMKIMSGTIESEAELAALLPKSVSVIATVPPIISEIDWQKDRSATWKMACIGLAACCAFIFFLVRIRPSL